MDTLAQINLEKSPACSSCLDKPGSQGQQKAIYVCVDPKCKGFKTYYCMECSADDGTVHDHRGKLINRMCDDLNKDFQTGWN